MEVLSYLLYLFLIICISIQAFKWCSFARKTKTRLEPPGPKPYPIIGNLLELGNKPHKALANLSKTYGPIMSLKLGQATTIVASSPTAAKDILQTHDRFLSNRAIPDAIRAADHGEFGIAWMPVSPTWRKLRKICNSHLFSAGVLDANMKLRHKKVQELLAQVRKSAETGCEAVDIGKAGFKTALNLLSATFFSMEHLADQTSSDTIRDFKETIWGMMVEIGKPNLADYFPLFRRFDPQGIRKRTTIHFRKVMDFFSDIIDQRLRERERSSGDCEEETDVLDTLINIMMKSTEDEREDHIDRTIVEHLLLELFAAGTETTSSTLEWSMAELLKSPEIMSKAKEELNQVIGKGNQVKESDITHLPYLRAIVKETFRLHPAVPFLLPRRAETDVQVCGYVVPEGSQVMVNVWAISRDPAIWDSPDKFMPERFLGSDIDVRGRDFELTPFGGGRRICPGLPLATRMLHLILGSLIHSFDWELENGVSPQNLDMEDKFGITLQRAQPLLAVPRFIT